MRKILIAFTLALSLAGCGHLGSIQTVLQLGTASVANPVTPTRLNQMENGLKVVFAGLNAWKKSCRDLLIPQNCRQQIAEVQVYTRQIPPYLSRLRAFVRNNDQVNASVVFNEITGLIGTVKSQAAAAGQQIGS